MAYSQIFQGLRTSAGFRSRKMLCMKIPKMRHKPPDRACSSTLCKSSFDRIVIPSAIHEAGKKRRHLDCRAADGKASKFEAVRARAMRRGTRQIIKQHLSWRQATTRNHAWIWHVRPWQKLAAHAKADKSTEKKLTSSTTRS